MIPWSDPLVIGAMVVAALVLAKGVHSLLADMQRRRRSRLLEQKEVRILMADYRARYVSGEARSRLEADLEAARVRLEGLAARWKDCQRRSEEALGKEEGRRREKEERRAYQAFLGEARRMRLLKQAEERLRG